MLEVLQGRARWSVTRGRCENALRDLPDNCIDAIVEDPPAWIGFMGKGWDSAEEVLNFEKAMREQFRVLKPGGHALVWAIPRTSHLTVRAIEESGFEIRDRIHDLAATDDALTNFVESLTPEQYDALGRILDSQGSAILMHIFGTGFPKSSKVSLLIDKAAGVKPIRVEKPSLGMATGPNADQWNELKNRLIMPPPTTPDAKKWAGWGWALKPAVEHWIVARKPFKGPIHKNVIRYGTGAINVDACAVGDPKPLTVASYLDPDVLDLFTDEQKEGAGRWPAHLVLEHALGCRIVGSTEVRNDAAMDKAGGAIFGGFYERAEYGHNGTGESYTGIKYETLPVWECALGCPVRALDEQSGAKMHGAGSKRDVIAGGKVDTTSYHFNGGQPRAMGRYGDSGGAARFYYQAKASTSEKNEGCENLRLVTPEEMTGRKTGSAGLVMVHEDGRPKANAYAGTSGAARQNFHPTVKSIELMRWLVRLVTPPNGIVLDGFAGSGSTGVACLKEGVRAILIDRDEHDDGRPIGYCDIARARCAHVDPRGAQMIPTTAGEAAISL